MKKNTIKKTTAKKNENNDTYNFFTALCASRKILVKGKIERPIKGTTLIFNSYFEKGMKYNKCTKEHYEVFQTLKNKTIKAFGLSCTFKQGEKIEDRHIIFDKMPKGIDAK